MNTDHRFHNSQKKKRFIHGSLEETEATPIKLACQLMLETRAAAIIQAPLRELLLQEYLNFVYTRRL